MARQVKTVTQVGPSGDGTLANLDVPLTAIADEYGNPVALDTMLRELLLLSRKQLYVLRAILANQKQQAPVMGVTTPEVANEEDFAEGNEGGSSLA